MTKDVAQPDPVEGFLRAPLHDSHLMTSELYETGTIIPLKSATSVLNSFSAIFPTYLLFFKKTVHTYKHTNIQTLFKHGKNHQYKNNYLQKKKKVEISRYIYVYKKR